MKIKPLQIGDLTIETPALLAPMAGYTTPPFRAICQNLHCGLVFTELVSAEGIIRRAARTMTYLDSLPEESPVAAHIYGSNPDSMASAARIIESLGHFDLIDINCGCPVKKIAGKGSGVALMRDPEKIRTIVQAVAQSTSLPVTVKTRIGISKDLFNISEVAHAVEDGGGSAISIHARFATARHSGPVDMEALKRIKSERSIPIIGNGGIASAQQASEMIAQTGVDGVMIGKGAIGNPWVFEEIYRSWNDKLCSPPSNEERSKVIARHLRGLHELMIIKDGIRRLPSRNTDKVTCAAFRGHLGKYLHGIAGVKTLQGNLMEMNSIEEVIDAVNRILQIDPEANS
ncbi:MAG: tRNA-dihydrouridine synthase [Chloroflexota bacterium]|nr:tRNA-dihydrouridine synthase [Chloroflexota bacterium]